MHLTATQAASVAARGGAARLLLTHVLDRYTEAAVLAAAAAQFSGPAALTQPGLQVELG
jgi:ribonuclease BN (tRNA processing enzyme)